MSSTRARALMMVFLFPMVFSCRTNEPVSQPVTDMPFNLVADRGFDSNGFPLNPRWKIQDSPQILPDPTDLCGAFPVGFPNGNPQCTEDEVTVDGPSGLLRKLICSLSGGKNFKGHINWGPATFTGPVNWTKVALDGDYNWDMVTLDNRIRTSNRETLHTEARGGETVKRFQSTWWRGFRRLSHEEKLALMRNRTAVISGLLNLDNVHGAYSELHPIYALAVRTDRKPDEDTGFYIDTWVMFLRSWGDQGFCSGKQHYLMNLPPAPCQEGDDEKDCVWIAVDLPLEHAKEASVGTVDFRARGQVRGPIVDRTSSTVTVRFALAKIDPENPPRKKRRPLVDGEIQLHWRPESGYAPPMGEESVFSPDEELEVGGTEVLLEFLEGYASRESREALQEALDVSDVDVESRVLAESSDLREIPLREDREDEARPAVESTESVRDQRVEAARLRRICEGARNLSIQDDSSSKARKVGIDPTSLERLVNECLDAGFITDAETGSRQN
jgi:hypothetical protein